MLLPVLRVVLCAHRIVRAQQPEFQCAPHRIVDASADLDQPSQRSFGIRASGIQKDAVTDAWNRVDTLPDRTRRITAFQGHRSEQQVREAMQSKVS